MFEIYETGYKLLVSEREREGEREERENDVTIFTIAVAIVASSWLSKDLIGFINKVVYVSVLLCLLNWNPVLTLNYDK